MKTFPFEAPQFKLELPTLPLWRPKPGQTYYISGTETVQIWTGDATDEQRFVDGEVHKSLMSAIRKRHWQTAMGKLGAYSRVLNRGKEPGLFRLEPLGKTLVVCEDGRPTSMPTFQSKELAHPALEALTLDEIQTLVGGRTWI
jgi:hypothetical protein